MAGGQLYVIEIDNAFGTVPAVYAIDGTGVVRIETDVPGNTISLAAGGGELFALTSNGEVYRRPLDGHDWTRIRRGTASAFTQPEYLYSILASSDGTIYLTGIANILVLDRAGVLQKTISTPEPFVNVLDSVGFVRAAFATDDERQIVIEATPYHVYVLDATTHQLKPWMDGIEGRPEFVHGPGRVVRHGDQFLMHVHDGLYVADGLLQPWRRKLVAEKPEDLVANQYCRGFCSLDAADDRWLMADGAGIHVMQGAKRLQTVYPYMKTSPMNMS